MTDTAGFFIIEPSYMNKNQSALYTLITVFFFWGFIAASNGIFIPFCKVHFQLSQFQSQLIDLTFYGGYFIGSLILFLFYRLAGMDFLNKIGYKRGIIYGLLISTAGALSIIPAVNSGSFYFILCSFFLVALGFSLQQTASQPYVIALGTPETGAQRLNLAGGVNSLGTTLGPILVSYFLFGSISNPNPGDTSIGAIKELYLIVASVFILMAVFFSLSKLPAVQNNEAIEPGAGALKFPQLTLGMLAIFIYVGVEVTIQSNMGALLRLPEFGGYDEKSISPFISLYWGSLMIGRWTGAVSVFNLKGISKTLALVIVPFVAFAVVLYVNYLHGSDAAKLFPYAISILVMIATMFFAGDNQEKALIAFSLLGLVAMTIGLLTTGETALFAFISGGLACSVLWPCIFSVALMGLGKYASQGSAFLIMMILGGAVIPPLQGLLADATDIHSSYIITILCFAYLAFYGYRVKGILRKQGIEGVTSQGGAH